MLITAIAIGLLCAYHFGFRAGVVAAGVTAVLLVSAIFLPMHALKIYGIVIVGVAGICLVGPRLSRDEARPVKRAFKNALKQGRRLFKLIRSRW